MTNETSMQNWRSPGAATSALLLAVVVTPGLTEPLPLWPAAWGYVPSVGTAILAFTLLAALISFGGRYGGTSE